ncbi:MAG: stage II sporulation protein P [Lachnospiraceae bacterium]|nr:stage II sporulation protein P [Lachnospiraceae bacterium]
MRREKKAGKIGRAAVFSAAVLTAGLLSSYLIEGKSILDLERWLIEQSGEAGAFAIRHFYPQLTYASGGGTGAELTERYLDPAYARYVAGEVTSSQVANQEVQKILLLSELGGLDGTSSGAGETPGAGETAQGGEGSDGTTNGAEGESGSGEGEASDPPIGAEDGLSAQTAAEIIGSRYSLESLSDFEFLLSNFYTVNAGTAISPEQLDARALLAKDLSFPVDSSAPQVLIYHTHYSEMYADSDPNDLNTGVIGVGNYLTELLTSRYGLQVIHDTTPYAYNNSYSLAEARVSEILAANPSIQVVIDLHRDAAGSQKLSTVVNGKETANIMFFNGLCQTKDGPLPNLSNPYLSECLAFSLQMKLISEAYYPGFARKNYLKAYQYNQHMCPRSTLIEVGADNNTFEEAKNAMEPLADILGKVLVQKSGT